MVVPIGNDDIDPIINHPQSILIVQTNNNDNTNRLIAPSAPILNDIENNHSSNEYVQFSLVHQGEMVIVRGERKPIEQSSSELKKIINGSTSVRYRNGAYIIDGIRKDLFEELIRFLETKFIKFKNSEHTLEMLEAAIRFKCNCLIINCVRQLDLELNLKNVVEIYRSLRYYNNSPTSSASSIKNSQNSSKQDTNSNNSTNKNKTKNRNYFAPRRNSFLKRGGKGNSSSCTSKTSVKTSQPQSISTIESDEFLSVLLQNCLQFIDMNADDIFEGGTLLQLRFEELEMIATRDTLILSSEEILINFLVNWSRLECERKCLDITDENRRRVLGALVYTPRYLTLTSRQFEKLFQLTELLDPAEMNLVRDHFKGKSPFLTEAQKNMLNNFRQTRPAYANMPVYLSNRSQPKNYSRKMRKYDRKKDEDGCLSACAFNCLLIFACLFD